MSRGGTPVRDSERIGSTRVPEPGLSWSLRLYAAAPVAPLWIGAALALAQLALYLGLGYAADQFGRFFPAEPRLIATVALLLAYLPTAHAYHRRWTARHLEALRPLLRAGGSAPQPTAPTRAAGVIGLLIFAVPFVGVPWIDGSGRTVDWSTVLVPLIGWLAGRFWQVVLLDARTVSALAPRLARVDLLDLGPLTPFVQQGMRSAFLIAVLISIGALYVVHPTDLEDRAGIAAYVAGTLLFGIAVLLLPLDGLRRRLRLEKSHALAQLRGALATERDAALTAGDAAERARAGLQGLLALEARLRSVREWQLSAPSLARFSLYMVLGLGSWIGAAWVERLLDALLD